MKNSDNEKFVPIYQPYDTTQAGLIRSAMEQADIICYVNNEETSGLRFGGMGIGAAAMAVMVPEHDADRAMEIIKELGLK